MKKVIDGKRYDTDTAEFVANWANGFGPGDLHYCDESLYLTKNGSWFIHGTGGARSDYGRSSYGGRSGGSDLVAMTPDEAYEWLEEKGRQEELECFFSDRLVDA